MSDRDGTLAYEINLAEWWEAHVLATDGIADRCRGVYWSLDKAGGGGIHRVRLTDKTIDSLINRCLDEAASHGSAVWAYVTEHATPDDAVERFKHAGFQHTKRFDVFVHPLNSVKSARLPKGVTIERMASLERFSKTVAHPYSGPVTTPLRRLAISAENRLVQTRQDAFFSYLLSVEDLPTSTVTVLMTDGMAGIYNVGTLDSARGRGYAQTLLNHALLQAKHNGASSGGLIAVAKAEPLYQRVGFRPQGWMSLLYYSKTKMQHRASG